MKGVISPRCSWVLIALCLLTLIGCGRSKEQEDGLLVAVSANAEEVLQAIAKAYNEQESKNVQIVSGSSGKLSAQISEGAPYHLFFSADESYPQWLYENGFAEGPPKSYAIGRLAIWGLLPSGPFIPGFQLDQGQTISYANPEVAPYGKAAEQVLLFCKFTPLAEQLILAESIGQVNGFINTQSVDYAFTSYSSLLNKIDTNHWQLVPDSLHDPIIQQAVVIKGEGYADMALDFLEFVHSALGRELLKSHGYLPPTTPGN